MVSVDQADLEASAFEDLIEGDPIDARALHGDGAHATLPQPVSQSLQILGEGRKAAYWLRIHVLGNCDKDFGSSNIDPGRMGIEDRQKRGGFTLNCHRFTP